jgi:hypothetical protein
MLASMCVAQLSVLSKLQCIMCCSYLVAKEEKVQIFKKEKSNDVA